MQTRVLLSVVAIIAPHCTAPANAFRKALQVGRSQLFRESQLGKRVPLLGGNLLERGQLVAQVPDLALLATDALQLLHEVRRAGILGSDACGQRDHTSNQPMH